jgi:hypothetical protein
MILESLGTPLVLPFLLLGAVAAGGDSGTGSTGGGVYSSNGPAVCNCTGKDASLSVTHEATVSVSVGAGVKVSASTGQSGSASQSTGAGQCIYFQYNFQCESHWWGWSCTLSSSSLKTRPTTSDDCR